MIQVIDVTLRSEERKEKRIEERKKEILQVAMTLYTNKKVSDMNKKKQDECMTCLTAYIHGLYPLSMISGTEHNLMKTAHMTQHPLSIFDAAYMGIDKILPK